MKLDGLIDLHCHILPGLDDGSTDWSSSIAMARRFTESGFTMVAATPHNIHGSAWSAPPSNVCRLVDHLRTKLEQHQIPLKLVQGMEIAISDRFWQLLDKGDYLPLGQSTTYLLEFPFQQQGEQTVDDFCRKLVAANDHKQFLLAHPERLEIFQNNLKKLELLYDNGCRIQLNFGSLLGWYGRKSHKTALAILQQGMCHILSSDCHGLAGRDVPTPEQLTMLADLLGEDNLRLAFRTNPAKVLHNEALQPLDIAKSNLEKAAAQPRSSRQPSPKKKSSFLKTLTNFLK